MQNHTQTVTLKELVAKVYPKVPLIGIYTKTGPIYPDFTDEMLETHGDLVVVASYYSKDKNVLVVSFDEDFTK